MPQAILNSFMMPPSVCHRPCHQRMCSKKRTRYRQALEMMDSSLISNKMMLLQTRSLISQIVSQQPPLGPYLSNLLSRCRALSESSNSPSQKSSKCPLTSNSWKQLKRVVLVMVPKSRRVRLAVASKLLTAAVTRTSTCSRRHRLLWLLQRVKCRQQPPTLWTQLWWRTVSRSCSS